MSVVAGLALGCLACRAAGPGPAPDVCDPAGPPAVWRDVGPERSVEDYASIAASSVVSLRGETRPDSAAGGYRVWVVVANRGPGVLLVTRNAGAIAVGFRPAARWDGPPAWRAVWDWTGGDPRPDTVDMGDSAVLRSFPVIRRRVLGDSLPAGAYCAAGVVALNGRKLVVPSGSVTF